MGCGGSEQGWAAVERGHLFRRRREPGSSPNEPASGGAAAHPAAGCPARGRSRCPAGPSSLHSSGCPGSRLQREGQQGGEGRAAVDGEQQSAAAARVSRGTSNGAGDMQAAGQRAPMMRSHTDCSFPMHTLAASRASAANRKASEPVSGTEQKLKLSVWEGRGGGAERRGGLRLRPVHRARPVDRPLPAPVQPTACQLDNPTATHSRRPRGGYTSRSG